MALLANRVAPCSGKAGGLDDVGLGGRGGMSGTIAMTTLATDRGRPGLGGSTVAEQTGVCNRTIEIGMPFLLKARGDSPPHRLLVPGDRRLKKVAMNTNGIALPNSTGTDCKRNRVTGGDSIACDAMRHSSIAVASSHGRRRLCMKKISAGSRWSAADALGHGCL